MDGSGRDPAEKWAGPSSADASVGRSLASGFGRGVGCALTLLVLVVVVGFTLWLLSSILLG